MKTASSINHKSVTHFKKGSYVLLVQYKTPLVVGIPTFGNQWKN